MSNRQAFKGAIRLGPLWDGWQEAGQAFIGLLSLPYFYLAVALVWWHASREVILQRKMFHMRMYGSLSITLVRITAGAVAGIALSVASFAFGAAFTAETLLCVWIAMLALVLLRLRYICMAYAAGLLGLLKAVLSWVWPDGVLPDAGVWHYVVQAIARIDMPGLLLLAGLLHVAEGLMVRLQGAKTAVPLYLEGKRGKPVGGFAMSGVWPIPLLLLVPAAGTGGFALPWTPIFGGNGTESALWSLTAFPVIIGFSMRTTTHWPEHKARSTGLHLMISGACVAGLAIAAAFWSWFIIVASVAVFVLHEGIIWLGSMREDGRQPLYAQDGSGVRILAVLPGSPAAEMGLEAGETIRKVNEMATRTSEDLHAALQRQSAFCKMEVINRDGHVKFPQRARYAGEHYQLGLILAPEDEAEFVAGAKAATLWRNFRQAGVQRREGVAAVWLAAAESGAAADKLLTAVESGAAADELAAAADAAIRDDAETDGAAQDANTSTTEPALPPRRTRR